MKNGSMRNRFLLCQTLVFLALASLFLFSCAMAENADTVSQAQNLTKACVISGTVDQRHVARLMDDKYPTYWDGTGGELTITLPEGVSAQGVSISFFRNAPALRVEALNGQNEWTQVAAFEDAYLNAYIPFDAAGSFRLRAADPAAVLKISKFSVWGEGKLPASVERWTRLEENADLMLVVTHPDDDIIWFGGLLPTYAGEKGKKVMAVYVAGEPSAQRKNELLEGLWTCGVHYYPEIGPFPDLNARNLEIARNKWGKDAAAEYITGLLRKYRPPVVVTQDIKGEYGHFQHILTVQSVIEAVTKMAADPAYAKESAALYGVFSPSKLYLHRWRKNEIVFDWSQPLSAFDGRSGFDVADEAFEKHVSQKKTHYYVYRSGTYDSQRMGLYWTAVGPDEDKNDIFEHVAQQASK